MEMGMKKQVLSPAVEYDEEADLSAQMLGIGSDGGQGLGRGSKQNAVNEIFVLVGDGGDLFRDSEDDMKIVCRENFGCSFFNPRGTREGLALGAMAVAAATVARSLVMTAVAALEMTAENCGTTHLDRGHDTPLGSGKRPIMLLAIGFAVAAEDVRHFQLWAIHEAVRSVGMVWA